MQSERKKPDRGAAPRLLFLVGATILVFYAALLLVQAGTLLAGASLHDAGTLLAAGFAVGYFWVTGLRLYRLPVPYLTVGFAGLVAITLACGWVAGYYFDLSWDGRDYQQKAIRQLVEGWNPVYTEIQPVDAYDNAWLNHYPKGPWIAAASVVKLTGDIESGKSLQPAADRCRVPDRAGIPAAAGPAALLAGIAVGAVPGCQPGQRLPVAELLRGRAGVLRADPAGAVLLLCLESADFGHLAALAAAIVVALNIKFTGTAYSLVLLAA